MFKNILTLFAAGDEPHISLKAEKVFDLFGLEITNSILYGVFVSIVIILLGVFANRKSRIAPMRGLAQIFEFLMEQLIDMLEGIFHKRDKAIQYAPIFGTFFVFIVLSNVSGLMPIVGEGVTVGETPLFRPFTADINGTIAISVIAIITVQYLSIKESGFGGHMRHYFTDKPFNPINFFIGILEIFGEFTRVLSLALRLFLNTAVGEILIAVFAFVGKNGASLTLIPIVLFEVLVALIQAYVFTVLAATYLGLAIAHGDDHDEHHETDHSLPSSPAQAEMV